MSTIGIKLADGSFYPLLEEGKAEKKKINLTTVQDNQTTVHVDVYRSESGTMEDAVYVDTLEIKDLNPHSNGEPSFDLDIGIDEDGQFSAEIKDPETGSSSGETKVPLAKLIENADIPPVHFEKDPTISESSFTEETDNVLLSEDDEQGADTMLGTSPNDEDFSFDSLTDENVNIADDDFNFDSISAESSDISTDTPAEESAAENESEVTDADGFVAAPVGIKVSKGHKKASEKKTPTVDEVLAENEDVQISDEEPAEPSLADIQDEPVSEENDVLLSNDDLSALNIGPETDNLSSEAPAVEEDFSTESVDDDISFDTSEDTGNISDIALPDFDDSFNTDGLDSDDSADDPFAIPEDPILSESDPFAADPTVDFSADNTSDDLDLPDFGDDIASASVSDDFSTDTVADDFSTDGLDSSDDTSMDAVGISGIFDNDFGEPDLSTDDNFSTDDLDLSDSDFDEVPTTKDPTFQPNNDMFSDLYDKETLDGDSSSFNAEEEEHKKTKTPVIICIICAIICILAVLFLAFLIPAKIKKSKCPSAEPEVIVEEPVEENEEIIQEPEETQTPAENAAEPEAELTIEVEKTPAPDAAKEDEIVVATTPSAVVPEQPAKPAQKTPDIRYKVKWGDTLWDISNAYYKNPWRYKYLARYNGIKNPDHIISGTWILIPAE